MLFGTDEELQYHSDRAAQELERAQGHPIDTSVVAHRTLANLHLARTELIKSMRSVRANGTRPVICHTDKEG